mgnify:CR=1 FL=1
MNLKIMGITLLVILALAIIGALTFQITKTTESQKAGVIPNFTFEPHQMVGCANYRIPEDFTINVNSNRPIQPAKK